MNNSRAYRVALAAALVVWLPFGGWKWLTEDVKQDRWWTAEMYPMRVPEEGPALPMATAPAGLGAVYQVDTDRALAAMSARPSSSPAAR
jgi:hypothetical protein